MCLCVQMCVCQCLRLGHLQVACHCGTSKFLYECFLTGLPLDPAYGGKLGNTYLHTTVHTLFYIVMCLLSVLNIF